MSIMTVWRFCGKVCMAKIFQPLFPCAAAGTEWIKDDQQDELFERSELSSGSLASIRCRSIIMGPQWLMYCALIIIQASGGLLLPPFHGRAIRGGRLPGATGIHHKSSLAFIRLCH